MTRKSLSTPRLLNSNGLQPEPAKRDETPAFVPSPTPVNRYQNDTMTPHLIEAKEDLQEVISKCLDIPELPLRQQVVSEVNELNAPSAYLSETYPTQSHLPGKPA